MPLICAALLNASLAFERWLVIPRFMLVLASGGVAAWSGHWAYRSSTGQPTWLLGALIVYLSLIPLIGTVLAPVAPNASGRWRQR